MTNENEIDYLDLEKGYQTKAQKELSKNQEEGLEPYDEDNLEGFNENDD